jgi:hypothetical protein
MPIAVVCPSCAAKMRAPDSAAGRKTKCPKCGTTLVVPKPSAEHAQRPDQQPLPLSVTGPKPTPVRIDSPPKPTSALLGRDSGFAARTDESPPDARGESLRASVPGAVPAIQQLDMHSKIAALAAVVGLAVLAVSPLFKWMNFGSGGVIGLKGDGKIVLGITLVAIGICIAVLINPKWLKAGVLAVQAWGTVAVFWMAALIWEVGSVFDSSDIKDNPFAGLLAMQISPGAGLYLGLIGALVVAAALGFVAVRRLLASGSIKVYFATQGLSVALGILLAFIVGLSGPSKHDTAEPKAPDLSQPFPPGDTEAHEARLKEISDIRAETQARNAALKADLRIKLAAIEADRVKQQEDLKKSYEKECAAIEAQRVKNQEDREKDAKKIADAEANLADLVKQQEDRAKTRNVVLPLPQATPGPLQDKESLKTKAAKPALPQAAKPALTQKERDQQIQRNLAKTRQAQGPDH